MKVEVFSKDGCVFCTRALRLLETKGIDHVELKLGRDFTREKLLAWFPAAKTYPVVVVDGIHIGGYDQLVEHVENQSQLLLEG
jgi:glutaredoxin 3